MNRNGESYQRRSHQQGQQFFDDGTRVIQEQHNTGAT